MVWILGILLLISTIGNIMILRSGLSAAERIITYEEFIVQMRNQVNYVYTTMKKIDRNGAFEADDEVGDMFKALLHITNSFENFLDKE